MLHYSVLYTYTYIVYISLLYDIFGRAGGAPLRGEPLV